MVERDSTDQLLLQGLERTVVQQSSSRFRETARQVAGSPLEEAFPSSLWHH